MVKLWIAFALTVLQCSAVATGDNTAGACAEEENLMLIQAQAHRRSLRSGQMCEKELSCKLELKTVKNSNMLGEDPSKPKNLRYGDVCSYQGRTIDMVVTAGKSYEAKSSAKSGMSGKFGVINMKSGTTANFTFSFVEADSDKVVTLDSLRWSVVDFDCNTNGCQVQSERKTFTGFSSYELGKDAKMTTTPVSGGVAITATEPGDGADNPTDPDNLTPVQERRRVTLEYTGVSTFTVMYELLGTTKGYRNFIFSAESHVKGQVPVPCPTPSPTPAPTPAPTPPTPAPTPNLVFPNTDKDKAMVFMIDKSGSMGCGPYWYNNCIMEKMKKEFKNTILNLKDYQYFSIVTFNTAATYWQSSLVAVTPANIQSAISFVDTLIAGGGTHYKPGLEMCMGMPTPAGVTLDAVYLLSDGRPYDCNDISCYQPVFNRYPGVKVRTIGLNTRSDADAFLKPIAAATGGEFFHKVI